MDVLHVERFSEGLVVLENQVDWGCPDARYSEHVRVDFMVVRR